MSLLFKHRFFGPIRAGAKTQTLRWWRRPMVRAGRLVAVPHLGGGRLRIKSVRPLGGLAELTESDAAADGFASLADLLAELRAMYPALSDRPGRLGRRGAAGGDGPDSARRLYRVRFRFVADRGASP